MEFATKEVEVASSTGVEVLAPPAGAGAGAGEGAGASGTEKESFSSQFWVSFSEQQAAILASLSPSATSDSVAAAKLQISELQSFVTAAAIDLPKYDLRRSSEVRSVETELFCVIWWIASHQYVMQTPLFSAFCMYHRVGNR